MAVNHVQIMLSFQITTAILFVIVATEGLGEKRPKHGLLHFSNSLSLDEYICDNYKKISSPEYYISSLALKPIFRTCEC